MRAVVITELAYEIAWHRVLGMWSALSIFCYHWPSSFVGTVYVHICLQVLTVLCNVAEKGPAYCKHLWPGPLLPSLLDTLAFSDTEVVGQSLELLQLLFLYRPEVGFSSCSQSLF